MSESTSPIPRRPSAPDSLEKAVTFSTTTKESNPRNSLSNLSEQLKLYQPSPSTSPRDTLQRSITSSNTPYASPSSSPRDASPLRKTPPQSPRTRKLSTGNIHVVKTESPSFISKLFSKTSKFSQMINDVMSKPCILRCEDDIQELRWKFYCSVRPQCQNISAFHNDINKIKYVCDIKSEDLLDKFWDTVFTTNLRTPSLIKEINSHDLELIGRSIEFLLESNVNIKESAFNQYAFLCYQELFSRLDEHDEKNIYHYEVAKYATLTENYTVAYPRFLKCITSENLSLEHDSRCVRVHMV